MLTILNVQFVYKKREVKIFYSILSESDLTQSISDPNLNQLKFHHPHIPKIIHVYQLLYTFVCEDVLPASDRAGGHWQAEAGGPGGSEQGLLLDLGDIAGRVRRESQGNGGGRATHRAVLRHWRSGQADPGGNSKLF